MTKRIRLFSLLLILAGLLFLQCCANNTDNNSKMVELPDLTGLSREQISLKLDELKISYAFKFEKIVCNTQNDYDKFVRYESGLDIGSSVSTDKLVYIYTTPLHLNINNLDRVTLDVDYKNKSFIDDGIGEVVLSRCVDGDTAYFYDRNSTTVTEQIRVRFLGIDTPESTYTTDPWGKAASSFTANILNNATTIVLEAEGARTETYGRYLAWVWVDGKLLNLQLVQEAYSNSTASSNSKYFNIMLETAMLAKKTGRRFYGEIDPNYNYKAKK